MMSVHARTWGTLTSVPVSRRPQCEPSFPSTCRQGFLLAGHVVMGIDIPRMEIHLPVITGFSPHHAF
jgi:hypothetical protein